MEKIHAQIRTEIGAQTQVGWDEWAQLGKEAPQDSLVTVRRECHTKVCACIASELTEVVQGQDSVDACLQEDNREGCLEEEQT